MADAQVLHDVLKSGIRWRVTLPCDSAAGVLVRFEKTGKGGRLLHCEITRWSPLYGWISCIPAIGSPVAWFRAAWWSGSWRSSACCPCPHGAWSACRSVAGW